MTARTTPHSPPAGAGRKEWTGHGVLLLPLLLVSMDVSVLYFAVPFIGRDLEPSSTQQLWIFDVYGFVLAGLLITMGSLGDRIGRRRLLLMGAAAFSLASLGAAYSHTAGLLEAARTAFTHGMNYAALGAAITLVLAAVLSAVFFRGVRVESPPAAEPHPAAREHLPV